MHAWHLNIQLLLSPFSRPDNLSFWQYGRFELTEIPIISQTIIHLCNTFKPVKINPKAVIDVWSVAGLLFLSKLHLSFSIWGHASQGDSCASPTGGSRLLCHYHLTLQFDTAALKIGVISSPVSLHYPYSNWIYWITKAHLCTRV